MTELIFLMCSERSGSNLITTMFDAHPEICGPGTAHLADSIVPEIHRYEPFDPAAWEALASDAAALLGAKNAVWKRRFTAAELRECAAPGDVAGLLRYVYEAEARAHGKRIVFVKENRIHEFADFLGERFPDARYVYLHRDPRDMAASWKDSYAIRGGVVRAAETWDRDQRRFRAMRSALADARPIPVASYEDLVSAPERTLRRICADLGLEFHAAMLEPERLPRTRANAAAVADWANLSRPIFHASVGSYRDRLTADEVRCVEAICREPMSALGYTPESEPLAAADARALRARLNDAEPVDKPQYRAVSEDERELRRRLEEVRARVRSRPTPPPS